MIITRRKSHTCNSCSTMSRDTSSSQLINIKTVFVFIVRWIYTEACGFNERVIVRDIIWILCANQHKEAIPKGNIIFWSIFQHCFIKTDATFFQPLKSMNTDYHSVLKKRVIDQIKGRDHIGRSCSYTYCFVQCLWTYAGHKKPDLQLRKIAVE